MHLLLYGQIQNVSFAIKLKEFVHKYVPKVRGKIKNNASGSVEVWAQGDIEGLKDLHRFLVQGDHGHSLRQVEKDFVEIKDYTYNSFEIDV